MINQYRGGIIPSGSNPAIRAKAAEAIGTALQQYEAFEFSKALESVWTMLAAVDGFIVEQAPWKLARSEDPGAVQQLNRHARHRGGMPPDRLHRPSSGVTRIHCENLGAVGI